MVHGLVKSAGYTESILKLNRVRVYESIRFEIRLLLPEKIDWLSNRLQFDIDIVSNVLMYECTYIYMYRILLSK